MAGSCDVVFAQRSLFAARSSNQQSSRTFEVGAEELVHGNVTVVGSARHPGSSADLILLANFRWGVGVGGKGVDGGSRQRRARGSDPLGSAPVSPMLGDCGVCARVTAPSRTAPNPEVATPTFRTARRKIRRSAPVSAESDPGSNVVVWVIIGSPPCITGEPVARPCLWHAPSMRRCCRRRIRRFAYLG
jgi:hypothetical protein